MSNQGSNNGRSKLRELDIRYIFFLRKLGHTPSEIAGEFDVAVGTIRDVLARRKWAHVHIEDYLLEWPYLPSRTVGSNHHNWKGGIKRHYLYPVWSEIKKRTTNSTDKAWKYYGGRGIKMAEEWIDSSVAFCEWVDENLGPRPDGYSLDRIDNNGNYEPGNLRWAPPSTQTENRRPRSEWITGKKVIEDLMEMMYARPYHWWGPADKKAMAQAEDYLRTLRKNGTA